MIFNPQEGCKLALLDLDEFAGANNLDQKREIEKKAAQWVVKQVLHDDNADILYEENGKPHLKSGVKISISHSHERLAVLFHHKNDEAGIDIEKVRDKILNIRHKFLSVIELKELENAPIEKYTLYWAVKEAVYKACGIEGLLFAEQIAVDPFEMKEKEGSISAEVAGARKKFLLHYHVMKDFVLVYTV